MDQNYYQMLIICWFLTQKNIEVFGYFACDYLLLICKFKCFYNLNSKIEANISKEKHMLLFPGCLVSCYILNNFKNSK